MKIILRRHAQTRGNLLSKYVGSTDEPLAPEGIATAMKVERDSLVKTVYASALARTAQTAALVYPKAEIIRCAGLNEMNFGCFEGKSWRDLETDATYRTWLASRCEAPCPGGERKDEFTRRCRETFISIIHECCEAGMESAHFVVHGGTIMAVMSGFVLPEREYFSWRAGFCAGFVVSAENGGARFELVETLASPEAEEIA